MNPEAFLSVKGRIKYVWQGRGLPPEYCPKEAFPLINMPLSLSFLVPTPAFSLPVMVFLPLKSCSACCGSNHSVTLEMQFLVNKGMETTGVGAIM